MPREQSGAIVGDRHAPSRLPPRGVGEESVAYETDHRVYMTEQREVARPSTQMASRQARLRQANLAIVIVLIIQFALGIGVNLYVTLPAAGHPGHASWFGNGALLALHASLGMFLVLAAIFVLVRAVMARNVTLIVTSASGLVAIGLAFFFGDSFTSKLTDGYSLGMAMAFAAALACYTIGLYAASTRRG